MNNKSQVQDKLLLLLAELSGRTNVCLTNTMEELDLDSMERTEMVMMIEDEFMTDDLLWEPEDSTTVQHLLDELCKELKALDDHKPLEFEDTAPRLLINVDETALEEAFWSFDAKRNSQTNNIGERLSFKEAVREYARLMIKADRANELLSTDVNQNSATYGSKFTKEQAQ